MPIMDRPIGLFYITLLWPTLLSTVLALEQDSERASIIYGPENRPREQMRSILLPYFNHALIFGLLLGGLFLYSTSLRGKTSSVDHISATEEIHLISSEEIHLISAEEEDDFTITEVWDGKEWRILSAPLCSNHALSEDSGIEEEEVVVEEVVEEILIRRRSKHRHHHRKLSSSRRYALDSPRRELSMVPEGIPCPITPPPCPEDYVVEYA